MSPLRRAWPLVLLTVVGLFVAEQVWQLFPLAVGCDFIPLRHAAQALLEGAPVYRDPSFVYPPTAAFALLPTVLLPETAAFAAWLALVVAALGGTAALVARGSAVRFGAAMMVLLGGAIAQQSLFAGNLSALLAPVTVAVLLAFHRERWLLGCAILAASLLIKPLLAPLILIPALRRRWLPLARTILPAGALLLLTMALVPGGKTFPRVLLHSLAGSNLHGADADENLAVRGWAESHGVPPVLGVLAAAAIGAAVVAAVAVRFRAAPPPWLGAVLLLGTFLAGGIAEANYLFAAAAAILLHLALRPGGWAAYRPGGWVAYRPGGWAAYRPGGWAAYLPGLALLAQPMLTTQTALVLGELALLAALLFEPSNNALPEGAGRPSVEITTDEGALRWNGRSR